MTDLPGVPVLTAIRDDIARLLHDWDHGKTEVDSPTDPCWHAWRVEADLLIPTIRGYLSGVWEEGARDGSRGLLPKSQRVLRNPYREHGNACTCAYCHASARGGGR